MTDLKEALIESSKQKRKEIASEAVVITEARRLLSDKASEDYHMLKEMGMHKNILKAEDLKGKRMELQALDEKYGSVFTRDEIKALACKFRLRFLPTTNYIGNVDPQMFQKIREFAKDTDIELRDTDYNYKFYILAPKEAFRLEERPKDPILFYKLDNDHYRMVHKWGSDFTTWREVISWRFRNLTNYISWFSMLYFLPVIILLGLLTEMSFVNTLIISTILSGVGGSITMTAADPQLNKNCWESSFSN